MSESTDEKDVLIKAGGGGSFFTWQLGALKAIQELETTKQFIYAAASAGALVAALTLCEVDPGYIIPYFCGKYGEPGVYNRFLGYAFIWREIIRECLEHLLPENAAEICQNRLIIHVTELHGFTKGLSLRRISIFQDRKVLINTLLASAHILCSLDGNFSSPLTTSDENGNKTDIKVVDGTLLYFAPFRSSFGVTSEVGRTAKYTVSHTFDQELDAGLFGMIRTHDEKKTFELFHRGYEYTK